MKRRILRRMLVAVLAFVGIAGLPGVAEASVTVPPGGFGHACSPYSYVQRNPNLYWQTCAWADNNEVYFNVYFGNASSVYWYVDLVYLTFIKSGVEYYCHVLYRGNFPVPPHSVKPTPSTDCVYSRTRGAYAAKARVIYNNYDYTMTSETLQVQ